MNILSKLREGDLQECVEIDLNQPVAGRFCVWGTWHKVEYEGLHIICGACGCYGHVTRNCTQKPLEKATQDDGGPTVVQMVAAGAVN